MPPQVPGLKEILLMGFYQPHEALSRFLAAAQQEFKIPIRWVCGRVSPTALPALLTCPRAPIVKHSWP